MMPRQPQPPYNQMRPQMTPPVGNKRGLGGDPRPPQPGVKGFVSIAF